MKLLKNRESGQALIMVLILLALGSLLLVPLLWQAFANLKYHQLIDSKTLEAYSADAGVQYVLCKLYNKPGGYTDCPLEVSRTINGRSLNVTANYTDDGIYKITSTATSPNGRSTTIESYVNLSAGAFAFAVASKESMNLENITVDSLPEKGEGNIHSNGSILLVDSQINGDVSANGTIISDNSSTGEVTEGLEVTFPRDYSELYRTMAQAGDNWTGPYRLGLGISEEWGPFYIDGDLVIESGANVTLTGTVYVTGSITVERGHFEGEQNVVAEGSISIEGGGYRSERIPMITSTNGHIKLEGPVVDAVVYAPNGVVKLEQVELYGAVGGKTVTVEQWSIITYAKQLRGRQDIPGGELRTIAYSFK